MGGNTCAQIQSGTGQELSHDYSTRKHLTNWMLRNEGSFFLIPKNFAQETLLELWSRTNSYMMNIKTLDSGEAADKPPGSRQNRRFSSAVAYCIGFRFNIYTARQNNRKQLFSTHSHVSYRVRYHVAGVIARWLIEWYAAWKQGYVDY